VCSVCYLLVYHLSFKFNSACLLVLISVAACPCVVVVRSLKNLRSSLTPTPASTHTPTHSAFGLRVAIGIVHRVCSIVLRVFSPLPLLSTQLSACCLPARWDIWGCGCAFSWLLKLNRTTELIGLDLRLVLAGG
jgi:hypothetical protein